MKNKLITLFAILFLIVICNTKVNSNEFIFESEYIEIKNNGNTIEAKNGVKITSDNKIEITADNSFYDKLTLELLLKGNVIFIDNERGIKITGQEAIYYKNIEKILSKEKSIIYLNNNYTIYTKNLEYFKKEKIIQSDYKTLLVDKFNNKLVTTNFKYLDDQKLFKGENVTMTDEANNNYFFKKSMINLDKEKILGKDIEVNFAKDIFGNNDNDPRLRGTTASIEKSETIVKNGIFTTCKLNDTCPPWSLKAKEIRHDKIKKTINYKDAVLQIYDKPVLYFPKFFHPDPTVKRQSGFLTPSIISSNSSKSSLRIPYYHVFSDNRDLTFSPRLYSGEGLLSQIEFRQEEKNYSNIVDYSHKEADGKSKSHLFSNSKINFKLNGYDNSSLVINLEGTNNDTYLKTDNIKTSQSFDSSSLNTFVAFNTNNEDTDVSIDFQVYENLSTKKKEHNRYEYIYPNFSISKTLDTAYNEYGSFNYNATGFQKKYNTNVSEKSFINNFSFLSRPTFTKYGFKNNFDFFFKNTNQEGKRSSNYKDDLSSNFFTSLNLNSSLPLKKQTLKYESKFTPKVSFRLSPTRSENLINKDRRIDIVNIFSKNRLGLSESLEGGQSLTVGNEYNLKKKNGSDILNINIAQIYRDINEKKLPKKSKMNTKSSDVVGGIKFIPSSYIDFDYDFSLDNNLKTSNYNMAKSTISINNFVTSFEFLEENDDIGKESYLSNETSYRFNGNNKLLYKERQNRKTNLKEFYNLVYQYENDCLVASIQYNKDYYSDRELKPTEELFFSITIVPFANVGSPKVKK